MTGEFRMKNYYVRAELVSSQTFHTLEAANAYMTLKIEEGLKVGCEQIKNLMTTYKVEVYRI